MERRDFRNYFADVTMSKLLLFRSVPAGHVLFELGSIGKEFYIILQGECEFYQKNSDKLKIEMVERMKEIEQKQMEEISIEKRHKSNYPGVPKISKPMRSKVEKRENTYYVYHMGALMNKINEMKAGECFGELTLISKSENEPRMATVLCTKNCEFAVLDRQSFQVICAK